MLIKLLKYDIKAVGRILFPQYLGLLLLCFFGTLMALQGNLDDAITDIIFPLVIIFCTVLTVSIAITTISLLFKRWLATVYENEAYFVQVLPISTAEFIFEKLILSAIFGILGALVLMIAIAIPAFLTTTPEELAVFFREIINFSDAWITIFKFLFVAGIYAMGMMMYFSFSNVICAVIAKRNQWIVALIFVGLMILTNYVGALVFEQFYFLNFFDELYLAIIFGTIQTLIYAFGTWYFLEKHYNL